MKNNKGFIAISLIYSFFLIFIITLLMIVSNYAKNRVLLNEVKNSTQEYLNNLAGFNPVYLVNKNYSVNEAVLYIDENWKVLKDEGEFVTLILNRALNVTEINRALTNNSLTGVSNSNKTLMCGNEPNHSICNYKKTGTTIEYAYYNWNISIAYKVVQDWFYNNPSLQKASSIGSLKNMSFSDNIKNYSDFIRIPIAQEFSIINNTNIWYLTSSSRTDGISYNNIGGTNVSTHNNYKEIRPVISVKKFTS